MTYQIRLYDHEAERFTVELAEEQLGKPCAGMSRERLKAAMREAYANGWSNVSMFIERDDEQYERELSAELSRLAENAA